MGGAGHDQRAASLELFQNPQQRNRVCATGQGDEHTVARPRQLMAPDGLERAARKIHVDLEIWKSGNLEIWSI